MLRHLVHVIHGRIREHAKVAGGVSGAIARAVTGEAKRSPHWPTIEHRWRQNHPGCAACGNMVGVQIHHRVPFHDNPDLELCDGTGLPPATGKKGHPPNLITLCESGVGDAHHHHLLIGHGGSFKQFNPNVAADAAELLAHPDRAQTIEARALANRKPNVPGE